MPSALRVGELLDESVVVDEARSRSTSTSIEFRIVQSGKTWDLSKIDFEKLKEDFKRAAYKNIEIADLRAFIQHKLEQMLKQNATRHRLCHSDCKAIIDRYNAGSSSADNYFDELMKFTQGFEGRIRTPHSRRI